jgi:hypothetical protein
MVLVEPILGQGMREPDISLLTAAGVQHIDVSIANPAAIAALAARSDRDPLAAAAQREARKRAEYADTLTALHLHPDALVPFVVEASGQLGRAATDFLDALQHHPHLRPDVDTLETLRFMRLEITHRVLRGNAIALSHVRAHVRPLAQ